MTEKRIHIVCTDKGKHGNAAFPDLILGGDGTVREITTRRSPIAGPRTRTALIPAVGHRQPNGTWRWECDRCKRNTPLRDDRLRQLMQGAPDGSVLDLSYL